MFVGTKEITSQEEKNDRITFKLADGTEGTATKRQFKDLATEEVGKTDDPITLMITKHDADVVDVMNAIANCDLTYNDAKFVLQRVDISLTEMMEQSLCKVVEGAFGSPLAKMNEVNNIPLRELNAKVK